MTAERRSFSLEHSSDCAFISGSQRDAGSAVCPSAWSCRVLPKTLAVVLEQDCPATASRLQICGLVNSGHVTLLREGYKAAPSPWLAMAVTDTGPSPANNLGMFPVLVPSCRACQHPTLTASRGPGWTWGSARAQRGKLGLHHLVSVSACSCSRPTSNL